MTFQWLKPLTSLTTFKATWIYVALLFITLFGLERLSIQFDYQIPILQRPTYLAVALMCLASFIYLFLVRQIVSKKIHLAIFPLFVAGLILRLLFLQSTPIHEDDFYRYFFDGSLTYNSLNPYQYSPIDALEKPASLHGNLLGIDDKNIPAHPDLHFLAEQPLMERVAYPYVSTIYPPIAQSVFALSYAIKPFDLYVWRGLLIFFEVISFVLLLKILQHMHKPMAWSAIYWLNPLLITETINAGHMDAMLVPVLLFTLLSVVKQRYSFAGVGLAIAVGIKVWPILLIPSLFRPFLWAPKKLFKLITPCLIIFALVLLPQLLNYANEQSGLANYTQYWRTNSFIFGLVEDGLTYVEQQYSYYLGSPQELARYLVAALVIFVVAFQFKSQWTNANQLSQSWLVILVCLFFLSPTGYPWYFIWFLPLLAIKPNLPLLSLTFLLPLYDLRYPLIELDKAEIFDNFVIPLQFVPPMLFILVGLYRNRRGVRYLAE